MCGKKLFRFQHGSIVVSSFPLYPSYTQLKLKGKEFPITEWFCLLESPALQLSKSICDWHVSTPFFVLRLHKKVFPTSQVINMQEFTDLLSSLTRCLRWSELSSNRFLSKLKSPSTMSRFVKIFGRHLLVCKFIHHVKLFFNASTSLFIPPFAIGSCRDERAILGLYLTPH